MSDRILSALESAILRMLRTTGGVPATKLDAPCRVPEQRVRDELILLANGEALVTLTPRGESLVAGLPAE